MPKYLNLKGDFMKKTIILLGALLLVLGLAASAYAGCKVGDKAEVLWKGKWYPATVKKVKENRCYIHYDGYAKSWDEWVGPKRIRIKGQETTSKKLDLDIGDPVEVKWKGTWYPAHVIAINKKKTSWKIHYDGYNNSWDEWVSANRIRSK